MAGSDLFKSGHLGGAAGSASPNYTSEIIQATSTVGGSIRILEDKNNGSDYVGLKAPDSISSDKTWTLPSADGTSGQYLGTNGSGQLGFYTIAGSLTYEYITSQTTSGASSVNFSSGLSSVYTQYIIMYIDAKYQTATSSLKLKLSADSGSTFLTDWYYHVQFNNSGSATYSGVAVGTAGTNSIYVNNTISATSGKTANGFIYLNGLHNTSTYSYATCETAESSGSNSTFLSGGGYVSSTSDVNYIRLESHGGLDISGTFILFGLRGS